MQLNALVGVLLIGTLVSCQKEPEAQIVVHHQSGDKSEEIFYLSERVAVRRVGEIHSLVLASWNVKPAPGGLAGDRIDKFLVTNLRKVGISKNKDIIFGVGWTPASPKVAESSNYHDKFLVVRNDEVEFFDTEAELWKFAKDRLGTSKCGLINISEFEKKFSGK
jgi:hypothetical protein